MILNTVINNYLYYLSPVITECCHVWKNALKPMPFYPYRKPNLKKEIWRGWGWENQGKKKIFLNISKQQHFIGFLFLSLFFFIGHPKECSGLSPLPCGTFASIPQGAQCYWKLPFSLECQSTSGLICLVPGAPGLGFVHTHRYGFFPLSNQTVSSWVQGSSYSSIPPSTHPPT